MNSFKSTNITIKNGVFDYIDVPDKAYFFGFIVGIKSVYNKSNIYFSVKDFNSLYLLQKYLILPAQKNIVYIDHIKLSINNKYINTVIYNHCKCLKHDNLIDYQLPDIANNLLPHFLRGLFDATGKISPVLEDTLIVTFTSTIKDLIPYLQTFKFLPNTTKVLKNKYILEWADINALDLLGFIYNNNEITIGPNKKRYLDWSLYESHVSTNYNSVKHTIKWEKIDSRAVAPFKTRISDSGYDLTLIDIVKETETTALLTTGLKIQPPYGWYFELVPRSSIYKYGVMQANSIGIIDRGYTGAIMVPLIKFPGVELPKLPARLVQIVPHRIIHLPLVEENINTTFRADGGFGSTDKKG